MVLIAGSIGVFSSVSEVKKLSLLDVFVYIYFAVDIVKGIAASCSLFWVFNRKNHKFLLIYLHTRWISLAVQLLLVVFSCILYCKYIEELTTLNNKTSCYV